MTEAVINGTWKRSDANRTSIAHNVKQAAAEAEQEDQLSTVWGRVCGITEFLRIGLAGDDAKLREWAQAAYNIANVLNDELSEPI